MYVERMIYIYEEEVQFCKWLWLLSKQMSVIVIAVKFALLLNLIRVPDP